MDIVNLKEKGLISLSAYNICIKYNLYTTVDLNEFLIGYTDITSLERFDLDEINELNSLHQTYNHSFKRLKGCESENTDEFSKTSSLGSEDQLGLFSKERETEIKNFYNKGEMSVRAYNICMENHLNTLGELIEYKEKYSDFYRLNKCGRKTNDELIILANKEVALYYFNNDVEDEVGSKLTGWNCISDSVNSLVKKDRDSINDFIKFVLSSISSRS